MSSQPDAMPALPHENEFPLLAAPHSRYGSGDKKQITQIMPSRLVDFTVKYYLFINLP
jgi:hypothetical protein